MLYEGRNCVPQLSSHHAAKNRWGVNEWMNEWIVVLTMDTDFTIFTKEKNHNLAFLSSF